MFNSRQFVNPLCSSSSSAKRQDPTWQSEMTLSEHMLVGSVPAQQTVVKYCFPHVRLLQAT